MDWLTWTLLIGGGALLALRLWLGPAESPPSEHPEHDLDEFRETEGEYWTAEHLARYGTETSIADLAAQGRADELRGLGYEGDIPGENPE